MLERRVSASSAWRLPAEVHPRSVEVSTNTAVVTCLVPVAILAGNPAFPPFPRLIRWAASHAGQGERRIERTVTIDRPPAEVYRFWRDFGNLPRFMTHLERVDVLDDRRSHWVARAPAGRVEWDAEIVSDEADRGIAWRSLPEAPVHHEGKVSFTDAPGGRGTQVRVQLSYQPPGGRLGVTLARLAGEEPGQQVSDELRRLKQVLECDEVIQVDERVSGRSPAQSKVTSMLRKRLASGGRR
jgi:uncharacterized membrane protein